MFEFLLSEKVLLGRLDELDDAEIVEGLTKREKAKQGRLSTALKGRRERELKAWRVLHRAR